MSPIMGITVIVQLQRQFSQNFQGDHIIFVHSNDHKYPELQENGSAESTREFVSENMSFACVTHILQAISMGAVLVVCVLMVSANLAKSVTCSSVKLLHIVKTFHQRKHFTPNQPESL